MLFSTLEVPTAHGAFGYALASLVWKGIGVDWIPVLGSAWEQIFLGSAAGGNDATTTSSTGVPATATATAQYPRRHGGDDDEAFWHWVYLLMYGVLGTTAQFCGLLITRRRLRNRESLVLYTRIYGVFHIIIGLHHFIWSLNKAPSSLSYGKLELWRFHLPGVYVGTTLSAMILMYHASHLVFRTNIRTAHLPDICYRKSIMDTATCVTFISFVIFLMANTIGWKTSFQTNQFLWAITMYMVPVVLVLGFVVGQPPK